MNNFNAGPSWFPKSKCRTCTPPERYPGCQDHCPYGQELKQKLAELNKARTTEKLFKPPRISKRRFEQSYTKLRKMSRYAQAYDGEVN